jgi:hypothetical protein
MIDKEEAKTEHFEFSSLDPSDKNRNYSYRGDDKEISIEKKKKKKKKVKEETLQSSRNGPLTTWEGS